MRMGHPSTFSSAKHYVAKLVNIDTKQCFLTATTDDGTIESVLQELFEQTCEHTYAVLDEYIDTHGY